MLTVPFLLSGILQAASAAPDVVHLKNAPDKADYARLPRFYSSDPDYDAFVNEWFTRHLSVDERGVYYGSPVCLGAVDHMWVIDWDAWMLPWIDRGAMGKARQMGSDCDVILTTIRDCTVDKYGYAFGARLCPEPNNSLGGYKPTFGWPWPKYNRNTLVKSPTGWEFNDPADGARDRWVAKDIELAPGYVDFRLEGKITGPKPELISPEFDVDVFQVPIVEIDVAFRGETRRQVDGLVDGLKLYWTTAACPGFSENRMVTVDFCDLPPKDYPEDYLASASDNEVRFPLYFPMYLHPEWGREGRRITRLKIVPCGPGAQGVTVSLNYVRASYDVRLTTSNSTLINSAYRFYMWSGDTEFLAAVMPKLRRAILFLNEHMKGREKALICTDWMVGKDGLGGDNVGHGQIGGYWDLLPTGRFDINSSGYYYYALRAMAELERAVRRHKIAVPKVGVLGPDNRKTIAYRETPRSLDALANRVKTTIEKMFWDSAKQRFVRNIDINGGRHDYGFLHHNLELLLFGVGTDSQRRAIVSWLNGSRLIEGDTSKGTDIYHWRFGPRFSTVQNENYYFWPWVQDRKTYPEAAGNYAFGGQYQNGGAAPFTGLFDLMARCSLGDQAEIDRAFDRTKEIKKWFEDVKSAGGDGQRFYRSYYEGHPERGTQQSPTPGALGLDREFLSDASLGTEFVFYAFLGIDSTQDGTIRIAPKVPTQLDKIGVTNVFYRGNYLTIEAGRGYVSLEGSRIPNPDGLKAQITIRGVSGAPTVLADGRPFRGPTTRVGDAVTFVTDLGAARFEIATAGSTKERTER